MSAEEDMAPYYHPSLRLSGVEASPKRPVLGRPTELNPAQAPDQPEALESWTCQPMLVPVSRRRASPTRNRPSPHQRPVRRPRTLRATARERCLSWIGSSEGAPEGVGRDDDGGGVLTRKTPDLGPEVVLDESFHLFHVML